MNDPLETASPSDADAHFRKGVALKTAGDAEAALTEFRRAVLADPGHADAHFEIGLLCRKKADADPYFTRTAYEAFQKAARLKPSRVEAHDHYISFAQRMGRLDELTAEYDALCKQNPGNELFEQRRKNIVTISLTMIPDPGSRAPGRAHPLRKPLLFLCLGGLLLGAVFLASPLWARRLNLSPDHIRNLVKMGALIEAAAAAGFLVRGLLR